MADIIAAINSSYHQRAQLAAMLARTEAAIARAARVLESLDARYLAHDTLELLAQLRGEVR